MGVVRKRTALPISIYIDYAMYFRSTRDVRDPGDVIKGIKGIEDRPFVLKQEAVEVSWRCDLARLREESGEGYQRHGNGWLGCLENDDQINRAKVFWQDIGVRYRVLCQAQEKLRGSVVEQSMIDAGDVVK